MHALFHTSAQLQFGDSLNKTERNIFVINFEKNLERIFCFLLKITCPTLFWCLYFLIY